MSAPNSLASVKSQLPKACRILAVSKLQTVENIKRLFDQGQRIFAENYAQEALEKQQLLSELSIEWHFIGRLQKNKVKTVVGHFELIHSVDSTELAKTIDQEALKKQMQQKILIQVNLAQEKTKGGISEQSLGSFLSETKNMSGLAVAGLMTMPPLFENPEDTRVYFRKLRELLTEYQKNYPDLKELSMGTSSDYLVAAQEGATIVRLGTILFGERIPQPGS